MEIIDSKTLKLPQGLLYGGEDNIAAIEIENLYVSEVLLFLKKKYFCFLLFF